ncbi:MAG: MFS transporter, partial [Nanoarchaeota archaeon]|nr:MFS transporter [Nanoarchaeota archaeon]
MENYEFRKAMHLVFFFGFLTAFILIVIPIYLAGIGLTGYQIGLLVAVYAITSIFVSFPTGLVNDGWTVRNTMILGIFLFSVFLIGTGFFTDFILLIPLFIIGGLGTNLAAVSLRTIIYKIKMKGEGRKFGTYRFVDVMGSAVGVLLVGVLISILDFSLGLKIIGLLYLLLIPLVSFKTHKAHKIELVDYEKDIV